MESEHAAIGDHSSSVMRQMRPDIFVPRPDCRLVDLVNVAKLLAVTRDKIRYTGLAASRWATNDDFDGLVAHSRASLKFAKNNPCQSLEMEKR